MKCFTIDDDNNITFYPAGAAPASPSNGTFRFATQDALTGLAINWPMSRLVDIHNSLAGVAPFDDIKPVNKFENREKAIRRIWNAIQRMDKPTQPEAKKADDAPASATREPKATKAAPPPTKCPTALGIRRWPRRKEAPDGPREGSKAAKVIELLKRDGGVRLEELMTKMCWQKHTVRGFMAGAMKKAGYTVKSFKDDKGRRAYSL